MFFLVPPALLMTAPIKPTWVWTLPDFPGRVYGLGVASVTHTRALAIRQATDAAKADAIARLRATLNADTQIKTEYKDSKTLGGKVQTVTASRATIALSDVRIEARGTDIPGLAVETTYLDEEGLTPTLYALA